MPSPTPCWCVATQVELGEIPRVTTAFQRYANRSDVIKLNAGDAMTGSLYYKLFQGDATAALVNSACLDAFTRYNHAFDDSDVGLIRFLDPLRIDTCQTPVLGDNVKPQSGTPLASGYVQPNTIKTVSDVQIMVIGIDIKGQNTNYSHQKVTTASGAALP